MIEIVMNVVFVLGPLMEKAKAPGTGPEEKRAAIGGVMGGSFGSCFELIYPIVLLIFMLRPSFAAAFRSADATTQTLDTDDSAAALGEENFGERRV